MSSARCRRATLAPAGDMEANNLKMYKYVALQFIVIALLFFGCKRRSPANEIVKNLNDISRIDIISYRQSKEGQMIERIIDKNRIDFFTKLFDPGDNYNPEDESKLQLKHIDGKICVWYEGNKKLTIDFDLDCCYQLYYNNTTTTELFTYRLGRYLMETNAHPPVPESSPTF